MFRTRSFIFRLSPIAPRKLAAAALISCFVGRPMSFMQGFMSVQNTLMGGLSGGKR